MNISGGIQFFSFINSRHMGNVSTVRVILYRVITVVIFVLSGTCIFIPEGYSQLPDSSVYTDQLGFVKEKRQFLVFDSLKYH